MFCQSCGASLKAEFSDLPIVCPHCTHRNVDLSRMVPVDGLEPVYPLEGESCPRCEAEFWAGVLDGAPIKFCKVCQGILISHGDFGTLIRTRRADFHGREMKPKPFQPEELKERCICPDCHQVMECYPYYGPGNAIIDSCENCDWVWLDGSELNCLIASPGLRPVS